MVGGKREKLGKRKGGRKVCTKVPKVIHVRIGSTREEGRRASLGGEMKKTEQRGEGQGRHEKKSRGGKNLHRLANNRLPTSGFLCTVVTAGRVIKTN